MPDSLQAMPTRADDDGCSLSTCRTPMQCREIVRHNLQRIQKIIQILNFADWSQPAHRHANRLPQNCRFTDARIGDAQRAVFILHSLETLVHVAKKTNILSEPN